MSSYRTILAGAVAAALLSNRNSYGMDPLDYGPAVSRFDLTIAHGHRTEAAGPFFYSEQKESQRIFAIPPVLSITRDPETEAEEIDFAYPFLTLDRFGSQYRWQFLQLLSWAGGPSQLEPARDRFTLFPVYFQQRSTDPAENYTAVFPFYGHLKNRLFRDEISFVMFPFYGQSRKKDVVTDNYCYPFYHQRHGDGLEGWQLWPFYGHEQKSVTTRTNGFGDIETIPGHESKFVGWPFYVTSVEGIGTENLRRTAAMIPFYSEIRSPLRDVTTYCWPFISFIDEREKKYHEKQIPWPLIIFAKGEGKTTSRVWPFYSSSHSQFLESDFYMWPVYKYNRIHSDPLDRGRMRILFFGYSDTIQKNTQTGAYQRLINFLPFYKYTHDYDGTTRLQALSLLEPFFPNNKSIERDFAQVWSIWRSEHNPKTGAASHSLLWNLYRSDSAPDSKKCSLLFGLFRYQSDAHGKQVRLLYIPLGRSREEPRT